MKSYSLKEIAEFTEAEIHGDSSIVIEGCANIEHSSPTQITYCENEKWFKLAESSLAGAVIVPKTFHSIKKTYLATDNPKLAFAKTLSLFQSDHDIPIGIHLKAIIAANCSLGEKISVGPYVQINENASIGSESIIYSGCYIGKNVKIGTNCILYPNVVILKDIVIGDNCIIHTGAVIGSDGFGYVNDKGTHVKIPQLGSVVIENDVEIGANTTIDRATTGETIIGQGTKIDNLVQIAHNVKIGKSCIIVSQVGIAGSVEIGDGVVIAGQAGIKDHIQIGAGAVIGGGSVVLSNLESGKKYWGMPARPHSEALIAAVSTRRLPQLLKQVRQMDQDIRFLKKMLEEKSSE